MKISVASASAKLRQSNRADKRIELTMQLLDYCWTARHFLSKNDRLGVNY